MKACYIVRDEISGLGKEFKNTGTRVFAGRSAYKRAENYARQLVEQWRANFQSNPYASANDKMAHVENRRKGFFAFHGRKAEVEEGQLYA